MTEPCLDRVRSAPSGLPEFLDAQTLRLQLAGTPTRATTVLGDWEKGCAAESEQRGRDWRAPARHNLWLDFVLILSYVVFVVIVVGVTASKMPTSILRLVGFLVTALVVVAGLFDVLENVSMLRLLQLHPSASLGLWPALARFASTLKFALLLGAILYVIVAWLVVATRKLRNEFGGYTRGAKPSADDTEEGIAVPVPDGPMPGAETKEADIADVIRQELNYLVHHRHPGKPEGLPERSLVGLALSGGGIRSATSSLGVLQGLAQLGILEFVDYLSTVSGGGYIGSCLSSLLSLNDTRIPKEVPLKEKGISLEVPLNEKGTSPKELPVKDKDPHLFATGDKPAFGVDWKRFPFRDDRTSPTAMRAIALTAHLRTHGNFLIARRGVLTRDTLRAVGNVVTGVVFNVSAFLLLLFAAAAWYLTVVLWLAPDVGSTLMPPHDRTVVVEPGRPRFAATDSVVARRSFASCDDMAFGCEVSSDATLHAPTFGEWVGFELSMLTVSIRRVTESGEQAGALRLSLGAAVVTGILINMLALLSLALSLGVLRTQGLLAPPLPGEGEEEVFDKSLLWMNALVTTLLVVLATAAWRQPTLLPGNRLVALWIPFVVLASARVASVVTAVAFPRLLPARQWNRRVRTLWGGYQALLIYGLWGVLALVLLAPIMFALASYGPQLAFGGAASLLFARLLTHSRPPTSGRFVLPPGLRNFLLAIAVVFTVVLGMLAFGALLLQHQAPESFGFWALGALATFVFVGWLVDNNKLSPHYFYRDRMAETYLLSELPDAERRQWTFRDAMELRLSRLHGDAKKGSGANGFRNPSPYHLISAAINLAGSRDLTRKDRKSGYWLFSKLYCGSTHTGFRPTAMYRGGETKLSRAMAISGAAASSAMGFHTFFAQAFATVLFNVRLGYWIENPRVSTSQNRSVKVYWPAYLWREVTMQTTERSELVNLSDGGHTGDNVGIYPLLQRRCKVIIAVDAEQDKSLAFGSFTEALRHAYIDEGIHVDIDLSMIRPDPETGYSRSHCAVGRILYPDRPDQPSWLIYLKNSLTGDEPEPVLNYKAAAPVFPHETTADQFFDDAQFESYRALGVHIVRSTFAQWGRGPAFAWAQKVHAPTP